MKKAQASLAEKLAPAEEKPERRLEYVALSQLQAATSNPKRHAFTDLGKSIDRFGFTEPVVLDERTNRLVAGHGRVDSLRARRASGEAPPQGVKEEGMEWLVPVLRGWASRSDTEAKAYLLASNKLTEAGGWDDAELGAMLKELEASQALDGVGFDEQELARLLAEAEGGGGTEGLTDPDEVPEEPEESWVQPGDLFQLGMHRILCGDSTKAEDVARVMGDEKADVCWTDPPWNVAIGTHTAYGDKKRYRPIANDNLGTDFPEFCRAYAARIFETLKPGAGLYLAMSTQEWPVLDAAIRDAGLHWSSTIIWAKDQLILSQKDYHTIYEPIWYGWRGDAARLAPLTDRTQTDLWSIPRPKRSEEHPTMKPVELVARALKNSSRPGAIVFEPFSGSGTTLIACEQLGRRCRAIELEPRYVQVALERWEKFTGKKAEKLG